MNYENFQRDIGKYKWRVKWEGILMLIIYLLFGIFILIIDGIGGLVSFMILFFFYPLFGISGIKASTESNISKSKCFKSALKITNIISGISSIITSMGTLCIFIDFRSFKAFYSCGIYIGKSSISICLIEFIWLSSIITFALSYVSYRDLCILFRLVTQHQENRYRPLLHQPAAFPQYVPMQVIA
ncbi:unnamed protein product [Blepharisma stoltei]|uniref:Multipass membrane protein n=1 Tax=Blepharisma stoltei TaxID=1481888 RepID=A0AAU9J5Q7_9CILI|nr:unnamed protein product [Blepharisma stoltei]